MKASELIKRLDAIIELYGDARVEVFGFETDCRLEVSNVFPFDDQCEQSKIGHMPDSIAIEPIS